jgi:hypothetical protein
MKRVLWALTSGIVITFFPLLVLIVLKALRDRDPSDITAIWVILWPTAIVWLLLPRGTPMAIIVTVGVIFTVLLYSSAIYLILRWRGHRNP